MIGLLKVGLLLEFNVRCLKWSWLVGIVALTHAARKVIAMKTRVTTIGSLVVVLLHVQKILTASSHLAIRRQLNWRI